MFIFSSILSFSLVCILSFAVAPFRLFRSSRRMRLGPYAVCIAYNGVRMHLYAVVVAVIVSAIFFHSLTWSLCPPVGSVDVHLCMQCMHKWLTFKWKFSFYRRIFYEEKIKICQYTKKTYNGLAFFFFVFHFWEWEKIKILFSYVCERCRRAHQNERLRVKEMKLYL